MKKVGQPQKETDTVHKKKYSSMARMYLIGKYL